MRPQSNDKAKNRRRHTKAWAPYNFVPLPQEPKYAEIDEAGLPQTHDRYTLGKHTGYFAVTFTTETPLFVRGMLTVKEKNDKVESRTKPEAFSIDGKKPVVPGSSLRGMLRTLVEIVTNSKMHFVSDSHKMFFRAVAADKSDPLKEPYQRVIGAFAKHVRAGYLVNDKGHWYIQPAKQMGKSAYGKVKDRDTQVSGLVRFNDPDYKIQYHPICYKAEGDHVSSAYSPRAGEIPTGMLVCTGNMAETHGKGKPVDSPRRRYAVVAERDRAAKRIPIPEQTVQDYITGRSAFQEEDPFQKDYGVLVDGRAVFYIEEGGEVIRFGHTPNFRIAPLKFENGHQRAVTPKDLVPAKFDEQTPDIDYAEALFGYVSEQNETRSPSAYAGRISVTSAHVIEERPDYFDRTIVPKILASPKPTTFQHYLEQPEGWRTPTNQLRHYDDDTTIRGYKLYWRQMVKSLKAVEETGRHDSSDEPLTPENSKQHTRMTPVRAGVPFCFRVYFENLSDMELGALIWVLTLGGDPTARHQLGMGKPFGLGIVKLESKLILTERAERYSKLFDDQGQWFTNESVIGEARQAELVTAFKQRMGDFDNQKHIRELKVLIQKQELNEKLFGYMQIETDQGNEYDGRPVLPYPSEVAKG